MQLGPWLDIALHGQPNVYKAAARAVGASAGLNPDQPVRRQRARFYVSGALTTVTAVCSVIQCLIIIHVSLSSVLVKNKWGG